MNPTARTILILYSVLSMIGIAAGLVIFRSTRVGFHVRTSGREELEKRESYWGITVVTLLVIALLATIFSVPYWTANSGAKQPQTIHVVGRQFAWTINPPVARVGVKTLIVVRSEDVNHGLGLYDPNETLVKQVNVLPGVVQNMVVTFNKPGIWHIRCLEFCGVDHHLMANTVRVTR